MTGKSRERFFMLVGQFGGATGALWMTVNNLYRVNGVGWLERQGWPLSNVYVCVGTGALLGAIAGLIRWRFDVAQGQQAEENARTTGFDFHREVTRNALAEAGGTMWTFNNWSAGANRQSGLVDGMPVELFDYTCIEKDQRRDPPATLTQTVALWPAGARLPQFELRPNSPMLRFLGAIGMKGVTFDPEQAPPQEAPAVRVFGQRYFLSLGMDAEIANSREAACDGEPQPGAERHDPIRRLFTTELLRFFSTNPGWCVDCDGTHLAIWRPRTVVPGRFRGMFLAKVMQLRGAILGSVQTGAGAVVPARPETGPAVIQGRLLGAMLGILAGFFPVASFATRGVMFFPIRAVIVVGGMALSIVAGWFLGGVVLTPAIRFLERQKQRHQGTALRPLGQPHRSTAVVSEEGDSLTVRFPPGGLIRGGGGALFAACLLVNLFLAGFSAAFVPDALRGAVRWVEPEGRSSRLGQARITLAPWKALLFMAPFWATGLLMNVALIYRARRHALLQVGSADVSFEEVTLFGTIRRACPRADLTDVQVVAAAKKESSNSKLFLVFLWKDQAFGCLGWRERTEVRWLATLVRERLGWDRQSE